MIVENLKGEQPMRTLKNDEFRPYKKGLRKCDRQKKEMQKEISELKQKVQDLQELNRKYYNLLDKIGRVKHEKIKTHGYEFEVRTVIF